MSISSPLLVIYVFEKQEYLKKYPKEASILRVAAGGNWVHQFRAVTLIRVSPFPYPVFNYAVVATDIVYSAYFLGSLVGVVPDVIIALYRLDFSSQNFYSTRELKFQYSYNLYALLYGQF